MTVLYEPRARSYNQVSPFHPTTEHPEYPFKELSKDANWGYEMVRRLLREMRLDSGNYNTPAWNPLGEFVKPGDLVLLKPNLVAHRNWGYWQGNTDIDSLITHGSVIRAIADYVFIALQNRGRVIVGDSPVQGTSWEAVCRISGLDSIADFYRARGLDFTRKDFRLVVAEIEDSDMIRRKTNQNILDDYVEVDLGKDSLLMPVIADWDKFAVTGYGFERMRRAHNGEKNTYLFPRIVFEADCFINLPKLKVHQKAGITCSLKNLVGIIGHKDYLPHFRMGIDEYPPGNPLYRLYWAIHHLEWQTTKYWKRKALLTASKLLRSMLHSELLRQGQGGWYANDTLWRTVLDINRVFFYYDLKEQSFSTKPLRNYLTIIDGLVGGEKESPLSPSPVTSKCILGGENPVAVDTVAAMFMGLDIDKIPQIKNAYGNYRYPLTCFPMEDIVVRLDGLERTVLEFDAKGTKTVFEPSVGWKISRKRSL